MERLATVPNSPGQLATSPHSLSIYDQHTFRQSNQFRVLYIQQGGWNENITCTIRVISLSRWRYEKRAPINKYNALSYVWDLESPMVSIYIDNQEFLVHRNLHEAVRRLRAQTYQSSKGLFVDAICINQSDISERNAHVALMGEIYSQCSDVIVWFGDLEGATSSSFRLGFGHGAVPTNSSLRHGAVCFCKQEDWSASADIRTDKSQSEMAMVAAPVILRLAKAEHCADLLACRLFDNFQEMVAFRFLMQYLGSNVWFKRMWTLQEALLPRKGRLYFGPVSIPLDSIFEIASMWHTHLTNACCRYWLSYLDPVVAPFVKACFFLAQDRKLVRYGHRWDLFALRIEYTDRKASLDVDLLYGLLGLTEMSYDVYPDYSLSAEDVFKQVSRNFLVAQPKYLSFWIFIYAPLKHKYPNLPSWAVDWTTLEEMEYQNSRYTWTGLQRKIECDNEYDQYSRNLRDSTWSSGARPAIEVHRLRFEHDTMVMSAQYLDSIAVVGEAVDHTNSAGWHNRFRTVIESWREAILARYTPASIYQTPAEFRGAQTFGPPYEDTWSTAWLKMLCAGHIPDLDRKFLRLSGADISMVAQKAASDSTCFFNFGHLDHHHFEPFNRHPADRGSSQLYQQFINFMPQVLEGKRMFITRNGYLGFGNMKTRMGDKLYLPTTCNAPLILRMAHATASTDRQTHNVVGACYMQGFMDGTYQDLHIPEEELYIV